MQNPDHNFGINIEGFASSKQYLGINSQEENNRLNYLLAEGRRGAVIEELGFKNSKSFSGTIGNSQTSYKVYLTNGKSSDVDDQDTPFSNYARKYGYAFADYHEMRTKLSEIMGGEPKSNLEGTGVEEAFARSVIISFSEGSLKYCNA